MGFVSKGLSKEQIKKIKPQIYSKALKKFGDSCTICFTEYTDSEKVRKLPCEHLYHS